MAGAPVRSACFIYHNLFLNINTTFTFPQTAIRQPQFLVFAQGKPSMIKGIGLMPSSAASSTESGQQNQAMVPVTEVGLVGAHDYHVASQSIYFSDRLR